MTAVYWSQWSHAEIASMHGIELEEVDTDNEHELEESACYDKCYDCSGCNYCLCTSY